MRRAIFGGLFSFAFTLAVALAACSHGGKGPGGPTPLANGGSGASGAGSPLAHLPPDTAMVVGINVQELVRSRAWQRVAPLLLDAPEIKEALGLSRDLCKFDPLRDVKSVVLALNAQYDEHSVVMLVSGDFDEAKLTSCVSAMMEHSGKPKPSVTSGGGVTTFENAGRKLSVGWADPHTMILTQSAFDGDPTYLASLVDGRQSARDSAELVQLVDQAGPTSTVWMAMEVTGKVEQEIGDTAGIRAITASADFDDRGTLVLAVTGRFDSAAKAQAAADEASPKITEMQQEPKIAAYLRTLRVTVHDEFLSFGLSLDASQVDVLMDEALREVPELMRGFD